MAKKRQWAREWPNKAANVADEAADAFDANALEFASIHGQALAISGIALGCVAEIDDGNTEDVRHMLLSVRDLAAAQMLLCVNGKDRAMTHRARITAARRGEY